MRLRRTRFTGCLWPGIPFPPVPADAELIVHLDFVTLPPRALRLQDREFDMGYDTRPGASDGASAGVSQTAVYDTGGSAPSTSQSTSRVCPCRCLNCTG